MPKLSYYQKKGESSPIAHVEDEKFQKKVLEAVRAIEMHMALSYIKILLFDKNFHILAFASYRMISKQELKTVYIVTEELEDKFG